MKWIKLKNYSGEYIRRGTLLKFQDEMSDGVIMMVCEGFGESNRLGLMRITGHKAGINLYSLFPEEFTCNGLRTADLIKNWNAWVCMDGCANNVFFTSISRI